MSEWIKTSDKMPEPYCSVWTCNNEGGVSPGHFLSIVEVWKTYDFGVLDNKLITHWMPIQYPDPPKDIIDENN